MNNKKYFFRLCFWEALFKWKIIQYGGGYEFMYAWYRSRYKLIKKGEI